MQLGPRRSRAGSLTEIKQEQTNPWSNTAEIVKPVSPSNAKEHVTQLRQERENRRKQQHQPPRPELASSCTTTPLDMQLQSPPPAPPPSAPADEPTVSPNYSTATAVIRPKMLPLRQQETSEQGSTHTSMGNGNGKGKGKDGCLWLFHDNPYWHQLMMKKRKANGNSSTSGGSDAKVIMEVILETKRNDGGIQIVIRIKLCVSFISLHVMTL